jgi:hypothetical protein
VFIGNVLIGWDLKRLFQDVFVMDAGIEISIAEAGYHDWTLASDRGGSLTPVGGALGRPSPRAGLVAMSRPRMAPGLIRRAPFRSSAGLSP